MLEKLIKIIKDTLFLIQEKRKIEEIIFKLIAKNVIIKIVNKQHFI